MSTQSEHNVAHKKHKTGSYVVGYLLSLITTAIAFTLALTHSMSLTPLMVVLFILAALQIVVQLFFFMHFTESDGFPYHVLNLGLALFFTFAFAIGSIWVMTFGNTQVY